MLNHKEPYCCPACRQPIYKREVLGRHLRGCCPDLLSPQVCLLFWAQHHPQLRIIATQADAEGHSMLNCCIQSLLQDVSACDGCREL